jgi:formate dehydrogenase major subunit
VDKSLPGFRIDVEDKAVRGKRPGPHGEGAPTCVDGPLAAGRKVELPERSPARTDQRNEQQEELGDHTNERPPREPEPPPLDPEPEQALGPHDLGRRDPDGRGTETCDQLEVLDGANQEEPKRKQPRVPDTPRRYASHGSGLPRSVWSDTFAGTQRTVDVTELVRRWPLLRQFSEGDALGLGRAVRSKHTEQLRPRTADAERVVKSVCPYCAVGCGQLVYVKEGAVTQIEGDPASPISRGRLCPKGSATKSLVTNPRRVVKVKYRRPYATAWEELSLDEAMDMIADRVIETRRATWQDTDANGNKLNRTMGVASLGGATLDNEENYLIKKLCIGLGIVQVENQARI